MINYTFSGDYSVSLDPKNRINIPSAIKKSLLPDSHSTLVFTRGFEDCVFVYPSDEWKLLTEQLMRLDVFDLKVRNFIRIFVGSAHAITMDSQGRVILPENVLKMANIEKEILFLGSINKLEMWNPAKYSKFCHENNLSLESLAEQINFSALLKNE